ncbi:Phytochrome B [Hibiscus syriacus]|uniref:Phytochrome B n=1 Tax=Hibiscus syriacus TaxID=106335 RepID=A0A6A3C1I7_HIBSY|nr:Phytochrome B [Hibiscus syriacus]
MDLVKCDGAALYFGGKCWLLGVTPTESEVKDIAEWLLITHEDSTGLSTDNLADAGYPGTALLGDAVCGMATARITSKDFLFWFRSHTAKEVKWGGAKHHPEDRNDSGRMHLRSSFNAFLEVVKSRSLPWEIPEINANSLQLIMRDSIHDMEESGSKVLVYNQQNITEMRGINDLSSMAYEMFRLIETGTAPVFGVDAAGRISGWNAKIAELTGLQADNAIRKSLIDGVVHEDSRGVFDNLLGRALQGNLKYSSATICAFDILAIKHSYIQVSNNMVTHFFLIKNPGEEDKNVELKFRNFGLHPKNSVIYIMVNARTSRDYTNDVLGVCFVGQDITSEKVVVDKFIRWQGDYKAIIQSLSPLIPPLFASDENACCSEWNATMEKLTGCSRSEVIGKMLTGEIFGGLCQLKSQDSMTRLMILLYQGISGRDAKKFAFRFFDRNRKFVEVYLTASKRTDANGNIIGCFCFLQVIVPGMQQASEEHKQENNELFKKLKHLVYMRQEMKNPLNELKISPGLRLIRDSNEFARLQFRMTHPGEGLPSTLVQEMFKGGNSGMTQEELGLNMSQKLLNKMNGHVRYVREHNKCYFLIDLEIRTRKGRLKASQAE